MKKFTPLFMLLVFSAVFYAQDYDTYENDENGKIFYKYGSDLLPESELESVLQQSNRAPQDLNLDWSNPDFNISENPEEDSWRPRMDVHPNGNAYVVYNDNHTSGLQKIMFRKKVVGQDWTDPIYVDTGGEIGGRNNHFPAIAVSPNGDLHVTYNVWAYENGRNYIAYTYYNSDTDTWNDGEKISDLGGTVRQSTGQLDVYSTDDNLPVVIWGYDYRENEENEEIYMKYFDGTDWSSDIPVSDITDGLDAGHPYIESIGDNKAMIIYSEEVISGGMELRYRIYDETTHELTPAKVVASENIFSDKFDLTSSATGDVMILTVHKQSGTATDILNVYDYDRTNDSFSLSPNTLEIEDNAGQLFKKIGMDCNNDGDCAIVFTNYVSESYSYVGYEKTTGFGEPVEIIEAKPDNEVAPTALFDSDGNLHVAWCDFRFDDGQGYDEREVFYKKGINMDLGVDDLSFSSITVFPNPSQGSFTIATQELYILQIIDILGKVVGTETISGPTQINHALPTGTYFLRLSNDSNSTVKKLLVK